MNKISISHIGLSSKDQILIRNLSRLSKTVMGQFELTNEEASPTGDILLIDADSANAQQSFEQMQAFKQFQSILCICAESDTAPDWLPTQYVITRPLILRKVTHIFETLLKQSQIETKQQSTAFSILVVDDALPVRTFMKQRLHDLLGKDIAVDLADGGENALKLASSNSYDLIFLDLMMPDMDGYQVCRTIKSQRSVPIVMLTSKSSALNKVKAKMSGSNGYITKPPSDDELRKALTRFLNRAAMHPNQWQAQLL